MQGIVHQGKTRDTISDPNAHREFDAFSFRPFPKDSRCGSIYLYTHCKNKNNELEIFIIPII